jgi:hypothetical protein
LRSSQARLKLLAKINISLDFCFGLGVWLRGLTIVGWKLGQEKLTHPLVGSAALGQYGKVNHKANGLER